MVSADVLVLYGIYIGGPIIAAVMIYKYLKKTKEDKIEKFIESPLKETFYDALKEKVNWFGVEMNKFKLVRDFQIVGHPRKYMIIDIEVPKYTLDNKSNAVKTIKVVKDKPETHPVKTRLMILLSGNKNIILRFLHLKDKFFIFELKSGYDELIKIEAEKRVLTIQGKIDLDSFGNVWIMSISGWEYLSNISIKKALEQDLMHSENMADRVVHYDIQQAKLERRDRINTELEKQKYEERKASGDSTIV